MNIEQVREFFPYLKSDKIYLNHAAISPLSTIVRDSLDEYLHIRSETDIEPYFRTLDQAEGAKDKLANLLNVNPNQISWSSNVSHSLNILAQGLRWKSGDEIILNNIEFPSNIYPFLNLERQGVKVKFAKAENGIVDIDQIEKLISPNTKLLSISMVQFLTGYRADLKLIGDLCEKNEIIFCVDGIQGIGSVKVDVKKCKIDFFTGGTHKWLMALQGLGYFYISEKLLEIIENQHVGWTSVKNPWNLLDYDLNLLENAEKFQLGTLPRIAIIALNSSLSLMESFGHNNIENRILDNSEYLISRLTEIGLNPILANVNRDNLAGIVTFPIGNGESVLSDLKGKNIECTLREGKMRVSPHFYNTKDELDIFVSELKKYIKK